MIKRQIALLICLLLSLLTLSAQRYNVGEVPNLVNSDNKSYHFGFILGLNSLDFNPFQSGEVLEDGKIWYGEDINFEVGFSIGIISDLRLAEYLDMRFCPVLYFGERTLRFVDKDGNEREGGDVSVKSNLISFPLLFKIRGQRARNVRPYFLGGFAGTVAVGRDKEAPIMLKATDYGPEIGFGFDIYLPYFKLCPEFKAFFGLSDVINRDRPDIASADDLKFSGGVAGGKGVFSKLSSRIFAISFNFE
jgi:hypothetical protein